MTGEKGVTLEPNGRKRRIADAVQGQGDRHKKLENPSHERGVVCGCHGVRATGESKRRRRRRRFVDVSILCSVSEGREVCGL